MGVSNREIVFSGRCHRPVCVHNSLPTSKEQWLRGRRRAERSYSTFKVRRSSFEEIPLIQGKEAAVLCWSSPEEIPHIQGKRNPSKMVGVARGRADTLTIITEN